MRIAIDGRTIVHGRSGVGTYAARTVRSLLRIDPNNEYVLFLAKPNQELDALNLKRIVIEGYERMVLNRWWENILLPRYMEDYGIDVYFSPAFALPILPRFKKIFRFLPVPLKWKVFANAGSKQVKYVVTIHDVISAILPKTFTPKMRMWQFIFNTNAARVADRIITDSESTKRDFMRLYGATRNNISVVHLSVDEEFTKVKDKKLLQTVRRRYDLPKEFILFVGTIEPRKNVICLAQAYSLLPKSLRKRYPLVISGAMGWYANNIVSEMGKLGLADSLQMIGYVDHEHLPSLYSLASLFVYPSLYEGFGYPPLEAMSCGVPVITSNTSSLPEVIGDAGIMINPIDYVSLANEMQRVLENPRLQANMRRKGYQRARMFSWEKTAAETLAILEGVVENR